ncbi:uncharacterized protein LOC143203168 [Rhynchophorus ferrugineus]|uniref:uncharacterized protein LOC143203168 n=1 Tax=Rhynchophorus ferrugineus TaxID=354439 RepID=UPI003FCDD897
MDIDNDLDIPSNSNVTNVESEVTQLFSGTVSKSSAESHHTEDFRTADSIQIRNEKEIYLREISVFRDTLFNNVNFLVLPERSKPVLSEEIRIQPNTMIFRGAFDGKMFNQKLTITNCSQKSVFIRISPPSSQAFQIKPIPLPHRLSPGLSISRNVSYLYTKPTAIPQASMDIYINNERMAYEFLV